MEGGLSVHEGSISGSQNREHSATSRWATDQDLELENLEVVMVTATDQDLEAFPTTTSFYILILLITNNQSYCGVLMMPERLRVDFNDGHFFETMGWSFFFPRHHCHRWFFNGFTSPGPSPLNVFLQINHWYRWFSDGFPKFRCDGQRWFRPWKRPKNAHNRECINI